MTEALLPALAGLRVTEISDGIPGGYCGRLMAIYGAEVIKVDLPEVAGEADAASWGYLHMGKKSVALDFSRPEGRGHLDRLLARSDAVVLNRTPQALEADGLLPVEVAKAAPGAAVVVITPFGLSGPYRDYRAGDLELQAWSGLMHAAGDREGGPLRLGYNAPEYIAGQHAFAALLAILLAGVETETRTVDLSILDCTLGCLNSAITHYSYCQEVLGGVSAGEGNASIYDARDGKVFAGFSASSRVGIDRLAEIVKRPLPSRDPAEVKDLLARLIAGLGKEEAMKLGQSVRFPWSIHNDLLSILDASHLRERAFFARPGGADDVPVASAPFRMGLAPPCLAPAPRAGADTVAVFAELNTVEDESTC